MISANETLAVMVSIGNREHLTSYTFPRMAAWAASHGYSSILLKKAYNPLNRAPHFNKLLVHKLVPGFRKYIIIDDDLLMRKDAPEIEDVPEGYIGLCRDAEQRHTEAAHVKWTGNTGFVVADEKALYLLEEAYSEGPYPFQPNDGSGKGIWGPHDQGIINHVLFRNNKIYQLNWRWNYQPILEFFINDRGWDEWRTNKFYRLKYYSSLLSPFNNSNKQPIADAYGLHMIRGVYPAFFSKIFK